MCGSVIRLTCLIAAVVVSVQPSLGYVDVSPDETKAVSGTTGNDRPELAGVVVVDRSFPFEIRNANGQVVFSGIVQDRVARSDRLKTLSFQFRIRDTKPGLPGQITEVRREGFVGWKTDMDFSLSSLGTIGPDIVSRDLERETVGFSFKKNPVKPDAESRFCFVLTDATEYDVKAGSLVIIADDGSKVALPGAVPKK